MNRYIVIRRDSIEELEIAVNAYVSQKGYEPKGGITSAVTRTDPSEIIWAQAMWKRVIDL